MCFRPRCRRPGCAHRSRLPALFPPAYHERFRAALVDCVAAYLIVHIIQMGNQKLWLWFGVVCGVGILNKWSMLFFGFGIFVGLVLTPKRRNGMLYLRPTVVRLATSSYPRLPRCVQQSDLRPGRQQMRPMTCGAACAGESPSAVSRAGTAPTPMHKPNRAAAA
jgi:hypothetical protein